MKSVSDLGLPICPYMGDTVEKISTTILDIAQLMLKRSQDFLKGQAKQGWTVNLASEYDCQNLFWTVVKPWLPGLAREEVTVLYDNQKKTADFNLFGNQLVIEMKFIKDSNSMSQVAKTLGGLAQFYQNNANVKVILFMVFVKSGTAVVDGSKWEADFTHSTRQPKVITKVLLCP